MNGVGGWAVEAMIASALLMAVVLTVRGAVRRHFGPQVAYVLWALPLLRLVLPPLPREWHVVAPPFAGAGDTIVMITAPAQTTVEAVGTAWDLLQTLAPLLAMVWGVGSIGFLVYHIVAHRLFCRRIFAGAVARETSDGVTIVTSAAAPGPLAFGIWRRHVAFPLDFAERYDADERALALAHEVGHHRRGDLIANWVALTVLALHWFNPLAWRAFRAFRTDQELANDAGVLAGRPDAERHTYACAIVKAAHGSAVSAACHLHTITDLKGRLKMLSLSPASRRRLASGGATVAALVVTGLALTASGSSAAAISAGVSEAVAQVTPPVPPAPPAVTAPAPDGSHTTSTTTTTTTGTDEGPHAVRKVVIVKDGKTTTYDEADIDRHLAAGDKVSIQPLDPKGQRMIFKVDGDPDTRVEVQDIPAISSAKCGIGTGKPTSMTIDSTKGGKRMVVICTDRIQRISAQAINGVDVADIQRNAMRTAMAALETARSSIRSATMTDSQRQEALAGIDQAMAEMKNETRAAGRN